MAGLGLILAGHVTAQTFTNMHVSTALNDFTSNDGAGPNGGLILENCPPTTEIRLVGAFASKMARPPRLERGTLCLEGNQNGAQALYLYAF